MSGDKEVNDQVEAIGDIKSLMTPEALRQFNLLFPPNKGKAVESLEIIFFDKEDEQ